MESAGFHDLLRRAQGGDKGAMDRLLVLLRPYLERTARNSLEGNDAAGSVSDLVQESWVRAWGRLRQFGGGASDPETLAMFRAWTARIVRNVCLQARRNSQRRKRSPLGRLVRLRGAGSGGRSGSTRTADPAASDSTPSSVVRREEETAQIRAALESLSDLEEKSVVRLRFFESLPLREIAKRLELSYDQVRDRFHKGMEHLGNEMRRRFKP